MLELVLERCVDEQAGEAAGLAMDTDELIGYLRGIEDDYKLTPMEAVLTQTEAIGDPSLPAREQGAILRWLGTAFTDWEERFSLEEPLVSQLRQLKPLMAILAITDPMFLTPGAHPLHQLLDTIQLNAIGWQPRLGRAGQALEKQVTQAVNDALSWLDAVDTDLAAISAAMLANAERDQARVTRMVTRLIETEQGRTKTADAKRQAAHMINAGLEQYRAPHSVGEFLKGPWYKSAQLVLLKFGPNSDQWRQMSQTTTTLLDSVCTPESEEGDRRQFIFDVVTQLPKELKRWLISLQHDNDAVSDAVGMVEFIHLRVLRQQPIELEQIPPIAIAQGNQLDKTAHKSLERLQPGQWFSLDIGDGEPLRAKLALRMDSEQQLLFCNHAGLKVLQQSHTEFVALMEQGKVKLLGSGASFSRALAAAAGIQTLEQLDSFCGAAAEQARREQEEQLKLEQEHQQQELEHQQRQQRQRGEAEKLQRERETAERLQLERDEAERQQREQAEADQLQREWDEAEQAQRARNQLQLRDQAQQLKAQEQAQQIRHGDEDASGLNLPMGAWLGFHDGDTPLLAKLAVHDREQDNYTFVNRSGIKMRQLNGSELLLLIERGLVDILESKSTFRDEITRARRQSPDE